MFQTDADSCGDKRKNCSDEQLAQKANGGDTDALAQLISHFLPVIKAKSGRYSLVGLEQDDFIQEGLIGLFNAVKIMIRPAAPPLIPMPGGASTPGWWSASPPL